MVPGSWCSGPCIIPSPGRRNVKVFKEEVVRTCNLLLTNRIWQVVGCRSNNYIMLYGKVDGISLPPLCYIMKNCPASGYSRVLFLLLALKNQASMSLTATRKEIMPTSGLSMEAPFLNWVPRWETSPGRHLDCSFLEDPTKLCPDSWPTLTLR